MRRGSADVPSAVICSRAAYLFDAVAACHLRLKEAARFNILRTRHPRSHIVGSVGQVDLRVDRFSKLSYLPPRGDPHWALILIISALIPQANRNPENSILQCPAVLCDLLKINVACPLITTLQLAGRCCDRQ